MNEASNFSSPVEFRNRVQGPADTGDKLVVVTVVYGCTMIGKLQGKLPIVTKNPVELSSRIVDAGEHDERVNRVTQQLTELTHDISIVESFSHIYSFRTEDGLVCVDSSGKMTGEEAVKSVRTWSTERVHSLVYTHGHVDHVGGSGDIATDAVRRGYAAPNVIGHEAVAARFDRYILTDGYNSDINARQFGGISTANGIGLAGGPRFLPEDVLWPDQTFVSSHDLSVGGTEFELHHAKGETDDHLWAWVPSSKALCVGDLVTWVFPNCGNPQKVQRFPLEWAAALREMQSYDAEWLLPAHGLPVHGKERIDRVLDDLATSLEILVKDTLEKMNAGESLDAIIHSVTVPDDLLARPWMQPVYDEPEFVVRNLWRLYGGWWDKNPANLKPAPESVFAAEVVNLAGGAVAMTARATEVADSGDLRLACQLIELAVQADPLSVSAHGVRADIYQARRDAEFSLMSKGIYASASRQSRAIAGD